MCVCILYKLWYDKVDLKHIFSPMTAHLDSQQKFPLVNENFHSHTRPMCMYGKVYYGAPLKRTCPNLKFTGPTPLHYQLFHTPARPMIINEVTNIIFFFVCIYIFTPRFLIINCLDLLCLHFWPTSAAFTPRPHKSTHWKLFENVSIQNDFF